MDPSLIFRRTLNSLKSPQGSASRITIAVLLTLGNLLWIDTHPVAAAGVISQITVADVHTGSADIVWQSDAVVSEAQSIVHYSTSCAGTSSGSSVASSTIYGANGLVHVAHLTGLPPADAGTQYYFTVDSSGILFNNGGVCYTFHTLSRNALPPSPVAMFGTLYTSNCLATPLQPANSGVVEVTVQGKNSFGAIATFANLTSIISSGKFAVMLGGGAAVPTASNPSYSYYSPQAGDSITLTVILPTGAAMFLITDYSGSGELGYRSFCFQAQPTVATVSHLRATVTGGSTHIHWKSAGNVLGYHVYDGPTRIESRLITSDDRTYSYTTSHHFRQWIQVEALLAGKPHSNS